MSAATIAFITALTQLIPLLVSAGVSIIGLFEMGIKVVSNSGDPTDSDWQALADTEATLRESIDNPPDPIVPSAQASVA